MCEKLLAWRVCGREIIARAPAEETDWGLPENAQVPVSAHSFILPGDMVACSRRWLISAVKEESCL